MPMGEEMGAWNMVTFRDAGGAIVFEDRVAR